MANYLIKYITTLLLMIAASNLNADIQDHLRVLSDPTRSTTELGDAYASILLEVTPSDLVASFANLGEPLLSPWVDPFVPTVFSLTPPSGTEADVDTKVEKLVYPSLRFDNPDFNWRLGAESQGLLPKYSWLTKTVLIVRMRRDVFVESVKLLSATHDLTQEIESIIPMAQTDFELEAWARAAIYVDSPAINENMLRIVGDGSNSDRLRTNTIWLIYDKMGHFRKSETFDGLGLWDGMLQKLYEGRDNLFEQQAAGSIPLLRKNDPRHIVLLMDYIEYYQSKGRPSMAFGHMDDIERLVGHPLGTMSFRDISIFEARNDHPIYAEVSDWISANRQAYEELAQAESEAMP